MRNKVLIRMMIEIICIYHNNNNVIVLDYANNDDKESDDESDGESKGIDNHSNVTDNEDDINNAYDTN